MNNMLPTMNEAVKRLMSSAHREIRTANPELFNIPNRATYAKAITGLVEYAGDAAGFIELIDAFLVVYVQNQKRGGVPQSEMIDVLAERMRGVLEYSDAMERMKIIESRRLS